MKIIPKGEDARQVMRKWRFDLEINQAEAARRLGVHASYISFIETGRNPIRPVLRLAMAAVRNGLEPE